MIRELLSETGADLGDVSSDTRPEPVIDPNSRTSDPAKTRTRELYAGYERNYGALLSGSPPYVLHEEYFQKQNVELEYKDPGEYRNHFLYLQGLWRNGAEGVVHARETEGYEDYIAIMFYGTSVNAVMSPEESKPLIVRLTIDGAPLGPEQAGEDVMYDDDGNSYVIVDEARMYRLVNMAEFEGHQLRLSSNLAGNGPVRLHLRVLPGRRTGGVSEGFSRGRDGTAGGCRGLLDTGGGGSGVPI